MKLFDLGKTFAYFDSTHEFPEEIIIAAQMNPYKILGKDDFFKMGLSIAPGTVNSNLHIDYKMPSRVVLNSGLDQYADRAFLRIVYTFID